MLAYCSSPLRAGSTRRLVRWWLVVACLSTAFSQQSSAQLPSGNWQYHWGDDFSGTQLDTTKWSYNYPWGATHNHDATMSPDNARLGDGTLSLVAERTGSGADFTSGTVSTGYTRATFNGGYIEARILLPDTPGSWPAFWGLYSGWPPESDIMEYPIDTAAGSGYAQDQYHTAWHHSQGGGAGAGQVNPSGVGDLGGAYHTFGMEWVEDDWVGYYMDGNLVSQFGTDAAIAEMQYMYLILNYAVGGWPGTPNTTEWPVGHSDTTKIDWVRVWQRGDPTTTNWNYGGTNSNVPWDGAGNWTNGVPNLGGVTANFDTVDAAQQTIDWSGRRTLSRINLAGDTRYRFGSLDDRLVLGYSTNGLRGGTIVLSGNTSVPQEIRAELEFSGGLIVNNNSDQPLVVSGDVWGDGEVHINGTGLVRFDGNNQYGGDTFIDSNTAGPATVLARGQHALGWRGDVTLGTAGNETTARLELENDSLVSNNIHFRGRHNDSIGIQNNSGVNTLSGKVSLEVGGDVYRIQSNAGQLVLSGKASWANGISLDNQAGSPRSLHLQGAGDGAILGAIADGTSSIDIVKSGSGTWNLNGANVYSGTTTVEEGTLIIDGRSGTGDTTVSSSATLGGHGLVRGDLIAAPGSTIRVGQSGLPLVRPTSYKLIDDFSTYTVGRIGPSSTTPNTTGGTWTGVFNGTANAEIVAPSANEAIQVHGTNGADGWRGAITDLTNAYDDDFSLGNNETGTYFFRVRRTGTSTIDTIFGLTDQQATTYSDPGSDISTPWNEYAVLLSVFGDSSNSMLRAYSDGSGDVNVTSIGTNQWLNVWVTVDNGTKSFRVATSTSDNDGTDSGRVYQFGRRTGTTVGADSLKTFGIHEARDVPVLLDDLYFTGGVDLSNPLLVEPELVGEILRVGGDFLLDGGRLEVDVSASTFDQLRVGGNAELSGTLAVRLADGYLPHINDSFTILRADSVVNQLALDGAIGSLFTLDNSTATELILTVVRELMGDFDGDGQWSLDDIDMLSSAIAAGENEPAFDMNGDGQLTVADLTDANVGWLAVGGALNAAVTGGNPFLWGDANLSGVVDAADYQIWYPNRFSRQTLWSLGNFNADGVVDGSDFSIWNAHKNQTSLADAESVPEPAASTLALVVLLAASRRLRSMGCRPLPAC
ncbi:MAG: family 16 glycosylhydrolase [Planctomycetales bacterium]|nr:family 16 glycosylhydrolase [Planctomycetales bacterium]